MCEKESRLRLIADVSAAKSLTLICSAGHNELDRSGPTNLTRMIATRDEERRF
jgi:hypothetical protein